MRRLPVTAATAIAVVLSWGALAAPSTTATPAAPDAATAPTTPSAPSTAAPAPVKPTPKPKPKVAVAPATTAAPVTPAGAATPPPVASPMINAIPEKVAISIPVPRFKPKPPPPWPPLPRDKPEPPPEVAEAVPAGGALARATATAPATTIPPAAAMPASAAAADAACGRTCPPILFKVFDNCLWVLNLNPRPVKFEAEAGGRKIAMALEAADGAKADAHAEAVAKGSAPKDEASLHMRFRDPFQSAGSGIPLYRARLGSAATCVKSRAEIQKFTAQYTN